MRDSYRRRREAAYARGVAEFDRLAEIPTFRDFVVLYIAEGYKRDRDVVSSCSSDPRMIEVVRGGSASCRTSGWSLQYHAHQQPDELRRYWGDGSASNGELIRLQRNQQWPVARTIVAF